MNKLLSDPRVMLGLGLGVLAVVYITLKGGVRGAAAGAVGAAGDIGVGVIEGIGEVVGVPVTSQSGCCKAVMAGDEWGVALHCPAADYLRYALWSVGGPKPDFVQACR